MATYKRGPARPGHLPLLATYVGPQPSHLLHFFKFARPTLSSLDGGRKGGVTGGLPGMTAKSLVTREEPSKALEKWSRGGSSELRVGVGRPASVYVGNERKVVSCIGCRTLPCTDLPPAHSPLPPSSRPPTLRPPPDTHSEATPIMQSITGNQKCCMN